MIMVQKSKNIIQQQLSSNEPRNHFKQHLNQRYITLFWNYGEHNYNS
jgi:hypothetical protein